MFPISVNTSISDSTGVSGGRKNASEIPVRFCEPLEAGWEVFDEDLCRPEGSSENLRCVCCCDLSAVCVCVCSVMDIVGFVSSSFIGLFTVSPSPGNEGFFLENRSNGSFEEFGSDVACSGPEVLLTSVTNFPDGDRRSSGKNSPAPWPPRVRGTEGGVVGVVFGRA